MAAGESDSRSGMKLMEAENVEVPVEETEAQTPLPPPGQISLQPGAMDFAGPFEYVGTLEVSTEGLNADQIYGLPLDVAQIGLETLDSQSNSNQATIQHEQSVQGKHQELNDGGKVSQGNKHQFEGFQHLTFVDSFNEIPQDEISKEVAVAEPVKNQPDNLCVSETHSMLNSLAEILSDGKNPSDDKTGHTLPVGAPSNDATTATDSALDAGSNKSPSLGEEKENADSSEDKSPESHGQADNNPEREKKSASQALPQQATSSSYAHLTLAERDSLFSLFDVVGPSVGDAFNPDNDKNTGANSETSGDKTASMAAITDRITRKLGSSSPDNVKSAHSESRNAGTCGITDAHDSDTDSCSTISTHDHPLASPNKLADHWKLTKSADVSSDPTLQQDQFENEVQIVPQMGKRNSEPSSTKGDVGLELNNSTLDSERGVSNESAGKSDHLREKASVLMKQLTSKKTVETLRNVLWSAKEKVSNASVVQEPSAPVVSSPDVTPNQTDGNETLAKVDGKAESDCKKASKVVENNSTGGGLTSKKSDDQSDIADKKKSSVVRNESPEVDIEKVDSPGLRSLLAEQQNIEPVPEPDPATLKEIRDFYNSEEKRAETTKMLRQLRLWWKKRKHAEFECERCLYQTDKEEKYAEHLKCHETQFVCKLCNRAVLEICDLTRHWLAHENQKGHKIVECDTCPLRTNCHNVMEMHMREHYRTGPRPNSLVDRLFKNPEAEFYMGSVRVKPLFTPDTQYWVHADSGAIICEEADSALRKLGPANQTGATGGAYKKSYRSKDSNGAVPTHPKIGTPNSAFTAPLQQQIHKLLLENLTPISSASSPLSFGLSDYVPTVSHASTTVTANNSPATNVLRTALQTVSNLPVPPAAPQSSNPVSTQISTSVPRSLITGSVKGVLSEDNAAIDVQSRVCKVCNETISNLHNLSLHYFAVHTVIEDGWACCPMCKLETDNSTILQEHVKLHHVKHSESPGWRRAMLKFPKARLRAHGVEQCIGVMANRSIGKNQPIATPTTTAAAGSSQVPKTSVRPSAASKNAPPIVLHDSDGEADNSSKGNESGDNDLTDPASLMKIVDDIPVINIEPVGSQSDSVSESDSTTPISGIYTITPSIGVEMTASVPIATWTNTAAAPTMSVTSGLAQGTFMTSAATSSLASVTSLPQSGTSDANVMASVVNNTSQVANLPLHTAPQTVFPQVTAGSPAVTQIPNSALNSTSTYQGMNSIMQQQTGTIGNHTVTNQFSTQIPQQTMEQQQMQWNSANQFSALQQSLPQQQFQHTPQQYQMTTLGQQGQQQTNHWQQQSHSPQVVQNIHQQQPVQNAYSSQLSYGQQQQQGTRSQLQQYPHPQQQQQQQDMSPLGRWKQTARTMLSQRLQQQPQSQQAQQHYQPPPYSEAYQQQRLQHTPQQQPRHSQQTFPQQQQQRQPLANEFSAFQQAWPQSQQQQFSHQQQQPQLQQNQWQQPRQPAQVQSTQFQQQQPVSQMLQHQQQPVQHRTQIQQPSQVAVQRQQQMLQQQAQPNQSQLHQSSQLQTQSQQPPPSTTQQSQFQQQKLQQQQQTQQQEQIFPQQTLQQSLVSSQVPQTSHQTPRQVVYTKAQIVQQISQHISPQQQYTPSQQLVQRPKQQPLLKEVNPQHQQTLNRPVLNQLLSHQLAQVRPSSPAIQNPTVNPGAQKGILPITSNTNSASTNIAVVSRRPVTQSAGLGNNANNSASKAESDCRPSMLQSTNTLKWHCATAADFAPKTASTPQPQTVVVSGNTRPASAQSVVRPSTPQLPLVTQRPDTPQLPGAGIPRPVTPQSPVVRPPSVPRPSTPQLPAAKLNTEALERWIYSNIEFPYISAELIESFVRLSSLNKNQIKAWHEFMLKRVQRSGVIFDGKTKLNAQQCQIARKAILPFFSQATRSEVAPQSLQQTPKSIANSGSVTQQQQPIQQRSLPQQQQLGNSAAADWNIVEQFLDEQEQKREKAQDRLSQLSHLQESPSSAVRKIVDTLRREISPTRVQPAEAQNSQETQSAKGPSAQGGTPHEIPLDDPSRLSPKSFQNMLDSIISSEDLGPKSNSKVPAQKSQISSARVSTTAAVGTSQNVQLTDSSRSQDVRPAMVPTPSTLSDCSTANSDFHHCPVHGLVPIIKTEPGVTIKSEPLDPGYEKAMTFDPTKVKVEVKEEPVEKEVSTYQSNAADSDSTISGETPIRPIGMAGMNPPRPIGVILANEETANSALKPAVDSAKSKGKRTTTQKKAVPEEDGAEEPAAQGDHIGGVSVDAHSDDSGICSRPASRDTPVQNRKNSIKWNENIILREVVIKLRRLEDILRDSAKVKQDASEEEVEADDTNLDSEASETEAFEEKTDEADSEAPGDLAAKTPERKSAQRDTAEKPLKSPLKSPIRKELKIVLDVLPASLSPKAKIKPGLTPPAKVKPVLSSSPAKSKVTASPLAKVKVCTTPPPKILRSASATPPAKVKNSDTPSAKLKTRSEKSDSQDGTPKLKQLRIVLDKDSIKCSPDGKSIIEKENKSKGKTGKEFGAKNAESYDDDYDIFTKPTKARSRKRLRIDSESNDERTHSDLEDSFSSQTSGSDMFTKIKRRRVVIGSDTDENEEKDVKEESAQQKVDVQTPYRRVNLKTGPIRDRILTADYLPVVKLQRISRELVDNWADSKDEHGKVESTKPGPKSSKDKSVKKSHNAKESTKPAPKSSRESAHLNQIKDFSIVLNKERIKPGPKSSKVSVQLSHMDLNIGYNKERKKPGPKSSKERAQSMQKDVDTGVNKVRKKPGPKSSKERAPSIQKDLDIGVKKERKKPGPKSSKERAQSIQTDVNIGVSKERKKPGPKSSKESSVVSPKLSDTESHTENKKPGPKCSKERVRLKPKDFEIIPNRVEKKPEPKSSKEDSFDYRDFTILLNKDFLSAIGSKSPNAGKTSDETTSKQSRSRASRSPSASRSETLETPTKTGKRARSISKEDGSDNKRSRIDSSAERSTKEGTSSKESGSKKTPVSKKRKSSQKYDVTQLKEFLARLLDNPEYNPTVIKWSHRNWREFQIIDPDTLASLWSFHVNVPKLDQQQLFKDIGELVEKKILQKRIKGENKYRFLSVP